MSIHLEQLLADLLNTPASAPSGPVLWIADESLTEPNCWLPERVLTCMC